MKINALALIIVLFSLCLVACQSEQPPTPTLRPFELPEVMAETSEAPATGEENETHPPAPTPDVPEVVISETQITVSAATPTITPMPNNNNDASEPGGPAGGGGPGGGEGGGSEVQPYPETTINTSTYEGAIMETQFGIGGGGGPALPKSCLSNNGLLLVEDLTTDEELLASGCVQFEGLPVIIVDFEIPGPGHAAPANRIMPGLETWNDGFYRHVFYQFEPFEYIRVLFYRTSGEFKDIGSLYGWQDVQVDTNGTFLLKARIPIPSENLQIVVQRSDGTLLATEGADVAPFVDPNLDSDGDGLSDNDEGLYHQTDPYNPDSDNDGLNDGEEINTYFTNPNNPDSDGDGRSDGDEVSLDTDPSNPMNVDDITQVTYQNGGQFVQQAGTEWIEYNNDGQFFYQEDSRDPWSIHLYDASRDLRIQLDLWTREVICSGPNCSGVLYPIERFSRGRACPFVFTFDAAAQAWTFDTTIIYQLVGPESERPQWRELQQFDGRLLIREVEPEISYLDQIYVVVVDKDGQEIVLEHDFSLLREADDDYFVMQQGDEFELSFPGYERLEEVSQVWVVAEGYYEPLWNTP